MDSTLVLVLWLGVVVTTVYLSRRLRFLLERRLQRLCEPGASGDIDLRWVAPERDIDPVCGKSIATAKSKPSVYDGLVYYFCSRQCREVFEAAPEMHAPPHDKAGAELERSAI